MTIAIAIIITASLPALAVLVRYWANTHHKGGRR